MHSIPDPSDGRAEISRRAMPEPVAALAIALVGLAHRSGPLLHVASNSRRCEQLGTILRQLDPSLDVLVFPGWDTLPYDRALPSRATMGRRADVLRRLSEKARHQQRILVTSVDALLQRVPPRAAWKGSSRSLRVGASIDEQELTEFLGRIGYELDEPVDDAGKAVVRGKTVEIFPAADSTPVRIEHEDGVILSVRTFDPVTQRSLEEIHEAVVGPATEYRREEEEGSETPSDPEAGIQHADLAAYHRLETVFDYVPEVTLCLEPDVERRRIAWLELIQDSYDTARGEQATSRANVALPPPPALYLTAAEWERVVTSAPTIQLAAAQEREEGPTIPLFATQRNSARAFKQFVEAELDRARKVILTAPSPERLPELVTYATRVLGRSPTQAGTWTEAMKGKEPLLAVVLSFDTSFVLEELGVVVVAMASLLGSRYGASIEVADAGSHLSIAEPEIRLGDVLIDFERGLGVVEGLEQISVGPVPEHDAIRLRFANDAKLMVPVEEADRLWRYGSDPAAVTLDRLDTDAWEKRRAEIDAQISEAAKHFAGLANKREQARAPALVPTPREYERVAARFPYELTADQSRATEAALNDLASGKPMDRLICGDVGFGKTEIAIRAAAAAVFAGKQVAVVAPTTVLVRQHLRTFSRRFAGLGIDVAQLSRLAKAAEAKATKHGLAEGRIGIVIGTHAIASRGVRFKDLALLVIDEEQRFGAKLKQKLRALASGRHVLTMTATPIPRTLHSAVMGLQEVSVLATPPERRHPIHTLASAWDPALVRNALRREKSRGGQSFVVCPRIEDIAPMQAQLAALAPELSIGVAHGQLPSEDIDRIMVQFAEGEGDVLLATNIIESGLDVPRANTILVWRADRFGLAQLHQLRGRVGRGSRRGVAYLLTDPETSLTSATEKRLTTLQSMDRLGAGFEISAQDLDLRGAGNLLDEQQSGHVKLIGLGLYRHLLARSLSAARGERTAPSWRPEINLGGPARIPEEYVPEPEVRINLYVRLARLATAEEISSFGEEIEDRFGTVPEPVEQLLSLARLRQTCRDRAIVKLDAGPQAIALTFREDRLRAAAFAALSEQVVESGARLICAVETSTVEQRLTLATSLIERLPLATS